jgi:hypothetical protein
LPLGVPAGRCSAVTFSGGDFGLSVFVVFLVRMNHSLTFRRRKALLMTETELRLIAAPAMIGLSSKPKNG